MQILQYIIKCHTSLDLWLAATSLDVYAAKQHCKVEATTSLTSIRCTKCLYLMLLPLLIISRQFYDPKAIIYYQTFFNRLKLLDKINLTVDDPEKQVALQTTPYISPIIQ